MHHPAVCRGLLTPREGVEEPPGRLHSLPPSPAPTVQGSVHRQQGRPQRRRVVLSDLCWKFLRATALHL